MIEDIKKDAKTRMGKSVNSLIHELAKIRTGRATTALLDHVMVENYGSMVPINQAANVNIEDARTITVSPWDKSMVQAIEKAIMNADLGLNPMTTGTLIRVPMPPLTEERRRDLVKVVKHEGEGTKVAVRNIRRDANSDFKALLKDKDISEDDDRRGQDDIQKITDASVAEIDKLLEEKESELMNF